MPDSLPPPDRRRADDARMDGIEARLDHGMTALRELLDKRLDELSRQLTQWQIDLPERYVPRREISERFANMAEDTAQNRRELEARIKALEDSLVWAYRLVIGAVVMGGVSLLFSLARVPLKVG